MDLEEKFKKVTGFDAYVDNDLRPKIYMEYYVEWLEEQLTIPVVTTRLFFFDCWKRDGVLETKEIEATCEEHATLKFEKEFGEDYGFDSPYS